MRRRFLALGIFTFFTWFLFFRSNASPKGPVAQIDDIPTATITKFLKKKLNKARPITFTVADNSSLANIHNIREKLLPWGRSSNFLVLCLDEPCMAMEADGIKRIDVSMVRGGRATVMIEFALHLTETGYLFIHVDSDICFTGSHDPFSRVLPFTNDNWDVQFMEEDNKLDPGFWVSRPTPENRAYLQGVHKLLKDKANKGVGATYLLREGLRGISLRYNLLDRDDFKSWSDHQAWESKNFATEPQIDLLIQKTTAIHFTCIDKAVRSYFGKLYGGWSDYNGYYSNVRGRYISLTKMSGTKEQLLNMIALAVQLAIHSERILILPYVVEITQKRMKKVGPDIVPEYTRNPNFPFYRVVDINSVEKLVDIVEASFALNREKYTERNIYVKTLLLREDLLDMEIDTKVPKLLSTIQKLGDAEVVSIDMQNFEMKDAIFFEDNWTYTHAVKQKLKVCANIEEKETSCDKRCT
ncbi:hypothetical protein AA313_de0209935 [Arthrobotrys entomopaga]|nr:hypothetical protein AA313_de0209935 [Arthrobotrys entomopaga]